MNDLIRPTLYEAWHEIRPVKTRRRARRGFVPISSARSARAAISWPRIAKCRRWRPVTCWPFGSAGAYGAVQSGTYNTRLLVPEVLVNGDQFHVAARARPMTT
jgi:diaminopimelate decarboxylase